MVILLALTMLSIYFLYFPEQVTWKRYEQIDTENTGCYLIAAVVLILCLAIEKFSFRRK